MASNSNHTSVPQSDRPSNRPTGHGGAKKPPLIKLTPCTTRDFFVTGDFDQRAVDECGLDAPIRTIEDLRVRDANGPGFVHGKQVENVFNEAMTCGDRADQLGLDEFSAERVAVQEAGYITICAKRVDKAVAMTFRISLPASLVRGEAKEARTVTYNIPAQTVTDILKTVHAVRALLERYASVPAQPDEQRSFVNGLEEKEFFQTWGAEEEAEA